MLTGSDKGAEGSNRLIVSKFGSSSSFIAEVDQLSSGHSRIDKPLTVEVMEWKKEGR